MIVSVDCDSMQAGLTLCRRDHGGQASINAQSMRRRLRRALAEQQTSKQGWHLYLIARRVQPQRAITSRSGCGRLRARVRPSCAMITDDGVTQRRDRHEQCGRRNAFMNTDGPARVGTALDAIDVISHDFLDRRQVHAFSSVRNERLLSATYVNSRACDITHKHCSFCRTPWCGIKRNSAVQYRPDEA
jgi:hypothetical protein